MPSVTAAVWLQIVTVSRQYCTCACVTTALARTRAAPAAATARRHGAVRASATAPQAAAIVSPMRGRYMKRSARAWPPTCAIPLTGTSMPRNHSQPTATYGARLANHRAAPVNAAITAAPSTTRPLATEAGNG